MKQGEYAYCHLTHDDKPCSKIKVGNELVLILTSDDWQIKEVITTKTHDEIWVKVDKKEKQNEES